MRRARADGLVGASLAASAPPPGYTLAEALDAALLERVYRLRPEAWRARTADFPALDRWTDPFDDEARHFVVLHAGTPAAAARLTVHHRLSEVPGAEVWRDFDPALFPAPIATLSRLVVDVRHRGLGLGRLLDQIRVATAIDLGCGCIIAATSAGPHRIGLLEAAGLRNIGVATRQTPGALSALAPPTCLVLDLRPVANKPALTSIAHGHPAKGNLP